MNYTGHFTDEVTFDGEKKTAISVRDGVLEYLGSELGMMPTDKTFRVYRSPAQIARAATAMVGIPLTNDHVAVGSTITDSVGSVEAAEVIDFNDGHDSRLAIQNRVSVSADMLAALTGGKRELSLGYKAELVPHPKYDYQQVNIRPHHLAVVDKGRCGAGCSFLDALPTEIPDMKVKDLLDTIEKLDEAQTKELNLALKFADAPTAAQVVDMLSTFDSEELAAVEKDVTALFSASDEPDEADKNEAPVTDSAAFRDAVTSAVAGETKRYANVVDRARQFVAVDYRFADKTSSQIMRDALATEHGSTAFEDAELPVAFKLLRKSAPNNLRKFGDNIATGKFTSLADKEL